jgi:hypothetical protein
MLNADSRVIATKRVFCARIDMVTNIYITQTKFTSMNFDTPLRLIVTRSKNTAKYKSRFKQGASTHKE